MLFIWRSLRWLVVCSLILLAIVSYTYHQYDLASFKPLEQDEYRAQVASASDWAPTEFDSLEVNLETQDARAAIVTNFLAKYNSPLTPHEYYGQYLVEVADRYQLDFRFLPAIMMEESNLCKNIPEDSKNCLGFGIHSKGNLGFDTYEEGFERAARELRANYVEQGRIKVSEIARKYTASVDKWTNSINQWMTEMKYDDRQMGLERKSDTNVLEYARVEME